MSSTGGSCIMCEAMSAQCDSCARLEDSCARLEMAMRDIPRAQPFDPKADQELIAKQSAELQRLGAEFAAYKKAAESLHHHSVLSAASQLLSRAEAAEAKLSAGRAQWRECFCGETYGDCCCDMGELRDHITTLTTKLDAVRALATHMRQMPATKAIDCRDAGKCIDAAITGTPVEEAERCENCVECPCPQCGSECGECTHCCGRTYGL